MIKDRIVVGVQSDAVRARLLRERDLQLSKAIDICKAAEASEQQLHKLAEEKNVHLVDRKGDSRHKDWKQVKPWNSW